MGKRNLAQLGDNELDLWFEGDSSGKRVRLTVSDLNDSLKDESVMSNLEAIIAFTNQGSAAAKGQADRPQRKHFVRTSRAWGAYGVFE